MNSAGARRSRTLPALIALGVLNHSVLTGSRVTVSLYALSQGASPLYVGTLLGLYSFLPMWFAVAAGRLSDRVGFRRPMLFGSLGLTVAMLLPSLWPGLSTLLVTTSLLGLAFMLFQAAAQNAVGALSTPEERARSFTLLALGYSVSSFAGPLIAGPLIDHASFAICFLVLALPPLVPAFAFARNRLELPQPHRPVRSQRSGVAELFRSRALRRVFIVNALLSMAWDLHAFFIPIYGQKLHLSASAIGTILAAFAAATFAVRLAMRWIARRLSEFEVLTVAMFIAGGAYALFPLVASAGGLMALSFLLGLALGSAQPMVMSLLHGAVPAGRMGEAFGVRLSIINASTFAVPLLFGAIGSAVGIGPVFWVVGGVLAGGGFFAHRR